MPRKAMAHIQVSTTGQVQPVDIQIHFFYKILKVLSL